MSKYDEEKAIANKVKDESSEKAIEIEILEVEEESSPDSTPKKRPPLKRSDSNKLNLATNKTGESKKSTCHLCCNLCCNCCCS